VSNVSDAKDKNRRGFLRKLFGLTASAGIAGLLVDRLFNRYPIPSVQATGGPGTALTVDGNAGAGVGTTQLSSSGNAGFLSTNTSNGAALQGTSTVGTGVLGTTTTGTGVQGTASSSGGTALSGFAGDPGAIPIVATGASGQSANLQEWHSGTAVSVVDKNGNFGIGTSSPDHALTVQGTEYAAHFYGSALGSQISMLIENSGKDGGVTHADSWIEMKSQNWVNADWLFATGLKHIDGTGTYLHLRNQGAGRTVMVLTDGGNVGIGTISPTHLIQLSGGAYSDGSTWNAASSVRRKENIEPLTDAVETLRQLHPVSYNYKKTPAKRTMGFMAEEVGKVLPTIVDWDKAEPGYAEGYDHVAILALAVQSIREQQKQIEALRSEIMELKRARIG
jgi:hypothetical protein